MDGKAVPVVVAIMGVSGAGKITVGRQLVARLGWKFIEGDVLHPPENVAKMKRGQPLTDADRAPWLEAVAEAIDRSRRRGERGVITCSALKRNYRRQIIGDRRDVRLVYLEGSREVIARRMVAAGDISCRRLCSTANLHGSNRPDPMKHRSRSPSIDRWMR
jgi:carbohydrate kinase (thermoresistant glucokinase family)